MDPVNSKSGLPYINTDKDDMRWWHILTLVLVLLGSTTLSVGAICWVLWRLAQKPSLVLVILALFLVLVLAIRLYAGFSYRNDEEEADDESY